MKKRTPKIVSVAEPIVLVGGQDSVNKSNDSFTINEVQMEEVRVKVGRDPSMFIPDQEDKPDPDAEVLMIAADKRPVRKYEEDPPLKPKRQPTMYVDGQKMSMSQWNVHDITIDTDDNKPKHDTSTMYTGDHQDSSMFSVEEVYNDSYPNGGRKAEQMSAVSESLFGEEVQPTHYLTSGDTDTLEEEEENVSFRTKEPSVSTRSVRSKKSRSSTKSGRSRKSGSASRTSTRAETLQSNWGASSVPLEEAYEREENVEDSKQENLRRGSFYY